MLRAKVMQIIFMRSLIFQSSHIEFTRKKISEKVILIQRLVVYLFGYADSQSFLLCPASFNRSKYLAQFASLFVPRVCK